MAMVVVGFAMLARPGQALAERALGIDVSNYQGPGINWTNVKGAGITFAWAKATEGIGFNDVDFTINATHGKAVGVYMGAYHYAHPELNTPAAEANHFWTVAGSYILADGLTLMPMLDVEVFSSSYVGASSLSDWVNQWCTDIVQDAANNGVAIKPVIYISACNARYLDSSVAQWGSDIANYNGQNAQSGSPWSTSACTPVQLWGTGVWNFWQYNDTGSQPGDQDVFYTNATILASTMLATASTNSPIYYWDPQGVSGANPYTGSMTGIWENSKWSYSSAGLASPAPWAEGKAACFGVHTGVGTPAYTVTMNSSHVVAGFFNGGLSGTKACDVTITGSGTINLASGPQALDAQNGSDGSSAYLRINCPIAGDGQLFPEGNGQSFLNAANTFTGGTQLGYPGVPFSGTVNFNNGLAFGTGTITLTNTGNGGTLALSGTSPVTVTNPVTVASATTNDIVGNAAGLTFSGNWSTGSHLLTLGTGSTAGKQTIISGVVSGTAGLKLYNSGTLVLSGANTYSGTTTINSPAVLTIGGAGQLGSGSYSGSIVNNGTFNYNSSANQTLSGVISGTGALVQNGSGQLTLSGGNTFTGKTTISGASRCIIAVSADNNLGAAPGSPVANQLTLNGGVGVGLRVTANCTFSANRGITLSGNGGSLEATSGKTAYYPCVVSGSGNFSSGGGVGLGYGTNVLSGANIYSGTTTITAGTLQLGANNTLPTGTALTIQADNNTGGGGVLYLSSYSQTIGSLASSTSNGGTDTPTVNLGTGTLTINQSINTTFAGTITGSGTLTKTGAGTLMLSSANNYTGLTTINGGTLEGALSGSIPGNVSNPAGTLQLDDPSAMASSANLTLAGAPGAGAVALSFSGTQTINALYFGTTQKAAGTWAASGAAHNNPAFAGPGVLNVLTGPASSIALSLTSGSNPSTYGSPLTFTANVTGNLPGGTVQFYVDGVAAGSPVTLFGGSAPLVISTLSVSGSPHQITAAYSGDDNNNPSTTASALSQTVTGAVTSTALASSQNPSDLGSNVTFTATVSSGVGTPGGNVVFLADAVPFSTNALAGGVAAASTSSLPSGTNTVSAQYAAQDNYLGSTNSLLQVVQSVVACSQTNAVLGVFGNPDGTFTITFLGTPQAQYYVVASPDLSAAMSNWAPVPGSTNTVTNASGLWQLTVTNTVSQQYYRSTAVSPCP